MIYNYRKELNNALRILSLFEEQGLDFSSIKKYISSFDKGFLSNILENNKTTSFVNNLPILKDGFRLRVYNFQSRVEMCDGILVEKLTNADIEHADFEHIQLWPLMKRNLDSLDHSLISYGQSYHDKGKVRYERFYLRTEKDLLVLKKVVATKTNFKIEFEGKIDLKAIEKIEDETMVF